MAFSQSCPVAPRPWARCAAVLRTQQIEQRLRRALAKHWRGIHDSKVSLRGTPRRFAAKVIVARDPSRRLGRAQHHDPGRCRPDRRQGDWLFDGAWKRRHRPGQRARERDRFRPPAGRVRHVEVRVDVGGKPELEARVVEVGVGERRAGSGAVREPQQLNLMRRRAARGGREGGEAREDRQAVPHVGSQSDPPEGGGCAHASDRLSCWQ